MRNCPESFFVATQESGELVGYCLCSLNRKSGHLISVAVHQAFRRKRIATLLLFTMIDFLIAHEVVDFWLEVNLINTEAIALHEKLGFEKMEILEKYYSDGADAVRMRLIIKKPA